MKSYRLEKAEFYSDGTLGEWQTSKVAGKPEMWFDRHKALESAERRSLEALDGCDWRVEGEEHW